MKRKRVLGFFCWAATFLLVAAASARAAEESGTTTEHANEIFKWINFVVVAGLVFWSFRKYVIPFFRKNAESIGSAITKATTAKAEADRQLREAEEKLAHLQQEVTQLRATSQREGAAEADRIRIISQSDAQKIGLAGKAEIEAAERAARLELKAIAANLAVDGAEALLVKELTPKAQESLVAAFVKSLEGRPN
jgi:F-type H+-transporting ATPase subunit b